MIGSPIFKDNETQNIFFKLNNFIFFLYLQRYHTPPRFSGVDSRESGLISFQPKGKPHQREDDRGREQANRQQQTWREQREREPKKTGRMHGFDDSLPAPSRRSRKEHIESPDTTSLNRRRQHRKSSGGEREERKTERSDTTIKTDSTGIPLPPPPPTVSFSLSKSKSSLAPQTPYIPPPPPPTKFGQDSRSVTRLRDD